MTETQVYRGYLIKQNPFTLTFWIEKDKAFISYAASSEQAKHIIDALVAND
jgi:hypothetical protein